MLQQEQEQLLVEQVQVGTSLKWIVLFEHYFQVPFEKKKESEKKIEKLKKKRRKDEE